MANDNWHGLGDVRALERKAAESMQSEAATIARMALTVVNDLKYLNGCVLRGRGADIDSVHPGRNVFEYIKELESASREFERLYQDTSRMHTEMQGIAQNALQEVERLTERIAELESENENLHIEHDVMYARIRDANGAYTPGEVARILGGEARQAAEAVRPLHEEKWVLHLIGPDDVIDQPDEMTALREANKLNIGLARRRAEDPSDHDPYCWAVVKDAATEPV